MHNEPSVCTLLVWNICITLLFAIMHILMRLFVKHIVRYITVLYLIGNYWQGIDHWSNEPPATTTTVGECLQMGEMWNPPCPLIFIHLSSSSLFLPPPSSKCLSIIHVQVQHQLSLAGGLKGKKNTDVQFSLPLCIFLYVFAWVRTTFAPFYL